MDDLKFKQELEGLILKTVRKYMKSSAFTDRKLTDTPTDDLQVVNRKYVTANGLTADRPATPITGQFYFDTTLGFPVWWDGADWVNASGTPS